MLLCMGASFGCAHFNATSGWPGREVANVLAHQPAGPALLGLAGGDRPARGQALPGRRRGPAVPGGLLIAGLVVAGSDEGVGGVPDTLTVLGLKPQPVHDEQRHSDDGAEVVWEQS